MGIGKNYTEVFNRLNSEDQKDLEQYLKETIGTAMFAFLGFFEEQEKFKLIYEENGRQVDLTEISEMPKAEPTIENGWIARFGKYKENEN